MCSARSVSIRSTPAAASASGMPISSPSIDFTRVAGGARLAADPGNDGSGLGGVRAQCTTAPEAAAFASNRSR